jgi:hypothetical protein
VTVCDSKNKKISAKHYTVTYSDDAIHAGKVKVTVKMDECYGNKKLTTSYTIKLDSKTAKLFPKRSYFKYSGGVTSTSFSYKKQPAKMLKKVLLYGDKDVEENLINYEPLVYNQTLYRKDEVLQGLHGKGDPLTFTGTIGDLIQCCFGSEITKVKKDVYEYYTEFEITCKDGSKHWISYWTAIPSLKGYIMVVIDEWIYAYIKP